MQIMWILYWIASRLKYKNWESIETNVTGVIYEKILSIYTKNKGKVDKQKIIVMGTVKYYSIVSVNYQMLFYMAE